MAATQEQESSGRGAELPQSAGRQRDGISWAAMLAWIFGALLVAGLVAYRLVIPFFHRN